MVRTSRMVTQILRSLSFTVLGIQEIILLASNVLGICAFIMLLDIKKLRYTYDVSADLLYNNNSTD